MSAALEGVLVVDFGTAIAGAYASALLGDMGAEVVKIEPRTGDFARHWPPFHNGEGQGFVGWNRNKKSLALDLADPRGKDVALRLIAKADVVVENFRPGVADRLGIGYESLSRVNPRLIYGSTSAFGRDGPYADRPGFDPILQAMGGVLTAQGAPGWHTQGGAEDRGGRDPAFVYIAVADYGAAMLLAYGVMTALFVRERTGVGQRVDTSLLNAIIAVQADRFLKTPVTPEGGGGVVPYQLFQARDAWFFLGIAHDAFWGRLCDMLGDEELAADPRFATNPRRVEHKGLLIERLQRIFRERDAAEWLTQAREAGLPCAPVQNIDEFMDDPQVAHNGMLVDLEHGAIGPMKGMGGPVKLSRSSHGPARPAPALGQHTRDVLRALGFSEAQAVELEQEGVVYQRP